MSEHLIMSIPANTADPEAPPPSRPDSRPGGRPRPRVAPSPWAWMTLACALLVASGGVRAWQDHRFSTVRNQAEAPPFPLKGLPRTLGDNEWRAQDGGELSLDPEVARIAGCSDSLIRSYRNTRTGASVTALILFGPAQEVYGHTPEVCYPSAGYQMVAPALPRTVACGNRPAAEFRSEVFARQRDQRHRREEVYYSFRLGDRWSPDPSRNWKDFRHHPSMFKVQVQRPIGEAEQRELSNPTEHFLTLLLPEIERRLAQVSREGGG